MLMKHFSTNLAAKISRRKLILIGYLKKYQETITLLRRVIIIKSYFKIYISANQLINDNMLLDINITRSSQ